MCVVCRGFVSARQEHHVQAGYPQVLSTYVCCKTCHEHSAAVWYNPLDAGRLRGRE